MSIPGPIGSSHFLETTTLLSLLRKVGHGLGRQPKKYVYYIHRIFTAINMALNHNYFMYQGEKKNPSKNVKLLKSTAYKILDPNGN